MAGAGRMADVPFPGFRSAARRWATALALLALLAQALATQASAGHVAGMLSAQWLTGQVCTGAGALVPAPLFGEEDGGEESRQLLAQCPLCAVAVMPVLAPQRAPMAPPLPQAERQRRMPALAAPGFEAPEHLLPPAQAPPTLA